MQRTLLNLIIDLVAAFLFLAMIATGYVIRFPLPSGTNKTLSLWGLTRHHWGEIHFWISLGLLSILAVHFVLHWQWLVTVIRQRLHKAKSEKGHVGWITAVVLVGGFAVFALAASMSVHERADPTCDDKDEPGSTKLKEPASPQKQEPMTPSLVPVSWNEVYPILERSCLSCHGPKKAKGNFRVDRQDDFFTPRDGNAWVIPGDPERSPLMLVVTGVRTDIAFPDRHKLSAIDVAVLKSWISGGARIGR